MEILTELEWNPYKQCMMILVIWIISSFNKDKVFEDGANITDIPCIFRIKLVEL